MVQVPLPDDSELSDETRATLALVRPLKINRMLANTPASLRPFAHLGGSILAGSQIDPRKRELAILRTAHVTKSAYEWTKHVRLGRGLGVADAEIEAIQMEGRVTALGEEENMLCRAADEIAGDVRLSDEALEWALSTYGVRQTCELILCCSFYNMVSRFLESTRVPLEEPANAATGQAAPPKRGS